MQSHTSMCSSLANDMQSHTSMCSSLANDMQSHTSMCSSTRLHRLSLSRLEYKMYITVR